MTSPISLENQSILVTGGAGFIGSNLVDALLNQGNRVTVLDDFSTGHHDNLAEARNHPNFTLVEGSILDKPLVESLVADVDVIFHLAVQCLRVCFDQPDYVHQVNATGTLNLLTAAHALNPGLKRFVYVSSSEVYGTAMTVPMAETHPLNPTTVYGASKLAGELYTQAFWHTYGFPTVILRPFNTYGYREHHEGASGEVIPRFVVKILNGQAPVIFGDGQQTRDFTFVSETVMGILHATREAAFVGDAVNIAHGEEVSIATIAEKLLAKLDPDKTLTVQYTPERPGDVHRHYADVTKLRKITGYQPTMAIDEGLDKYITWFQKTHPHPASLLKDCQPENWKLTPAVSSAP